MKWSNFRKIQWPKLTQEKVNNMGTQIKCKRLSQKLPKKKSPGPDGFTIKFYQTFHEVTQLFYKLSHQETEVAFPFSFCDASFTLITKLEINIIRNGHYRAISLMSMNIKLDAATCTKITQCEQTVFTLEIQGGLTLKTNECNMI